MSGSSDRTPFVGRAREMAALREELDSAARGRGGVVLVAGEPGSGKTRLLDELAVEAERAGAAVLRGGASDAEGMPPYLPFLEALGQHIRVADPAVLRDQAGPTAAILATILPDLAARLGDLPAAYPLPPEQARLRLFEAVSAFLGAIAAARPVLLILDDLHWADRATLDLLAYIATHQGDAGLLILGAYRDAELEQNVAWERLVDELTRRRRLTSLRLGRLIASDLAALAAGYLGAPIEPPVGQVLDQQSEGNAFFAEELLGSWFESGVLVRAEESWVFAAQPDTTLPPTIVGTVRRRLARLTPVVVEHLRTAATIGRTFDVALLADVVGQDAEGVEELLGAAVRARLLVSGGGGELTFSHDKIRECLHAEVTATRRMRLHAAIGRALEARIVPASALSLADLAFHFTRSGDRARGVAYAQRAAEYAMLAYAAEEAVRHYQSALDLLDPGDGRAAELLLGLGDAVLLAGGEREAAAAYADAQRAFLLADDGFNAARAAHREGRAWARLEAHGAAQAAFEAALGLLKDRPGTETCEVLVDLANLLAVSMGRQTEGIAAGQAALDLARGLGEVRLEAAATRTLGMLLARMGDVSTGVRLLERALALATTSDDPVEAAECCAYLLPVAVWACEVRRGADIGRQRIALAHRCHDPYQLRHACTALAHVLVLQGRFAEAAQQIAAGREAVERLASAEPLAFLRVVEGELAYELGDYGQAEAALLAATATYRALGPAALIWYLGLLGCAQVAAGNRRTARATMEELDAVIAASPPGSMGVAHALMRQGLLAVMLGDRQRSATVYAELTAFRGLYTSVQADSVLGALALDLGDYPTAQALLDAAEAAARREQLQPELGRILAARADLALARGGRGSAVEARRWLKQALDQFEALGMVGEAHRVRLRLRQLPSQPGAPAPPSRPAGLSEREVEVLRLMAAGMSNREIAHALALSRKTVANYVTGILNKTGCGNRAAAAAFATRHDLA